MQQYLLKNSFREKLDAIGYHLLIFLLCWGWFLLLWGLRMQALIAGTGLYGLCLMLRSKTRAHRLAQKEQRLRRQLGGEMLLEKLLFSPAEKAHFEAALHLTVAENAVMERITPQGILCKKDEKSVLISFVQVPAASSLSDRDVLSYQRAALSEKADALWLCVPCPIGEAARTQAETHLPVRLIEREKLIRLFGAASPATDRQLVALGKERKKKIPFRQVLALIFQPDKTRRYVLYGTLLLFLYTLTGLFYYAIPGTICVILATLSHCYHSR